MIGAVIGIAKAVDDARTLFDMAKIAIDGWAVIDERKRLRREEQRNQQLAEMEQRISELEQRARRRRRE